jgi:hypothetical protein
MSGLSRQELVIVIAMGVGTVIVLAVLGGIVISSMTPLMQQQARQTASVPTDTPRPTIVAFPTWTPEPTAIPQVVPTVELRPLENDSVLDQVEADVSAARLLLPGSAVPRWSVPRRYLHARYGDMLESEGWQTALSSLSTAWAALDFIPPNTDLTPILRDIYAEQVYEYYDPETGEIYVLHDIDTSAPLGRTAYAHAYDHALQDQHFGLVGLGLLVSESFSYDDRLLAINGLVEGDAALLQEHYIATYLTYPEQVQVEQDLRRLGSSVLHSAPRVVSELFQFPQKAGASFAKALHDSGGWDAVNAAYASPPVSTEQILHPQRYLAGDQPVSILLPSLAHVLGDDWRLAYDGTAGELLLRLYLENRLGAEEAAVAAEGWGGGRCAVYRNDVANQSVMLLHVVWDTAADAREFRDAYVGYADGRFGHAADQAEGGMTCWEGDDVLCVAQAGDVVIVGLGPDRETVDKVMAVAIP